METKSDRKSGSNLGRAKIDWDEAFNYYASLPRRQRCYQAVAGRFGVSVRTVEKHGRNERWKERLKSIRAHAASEVDKTLSVTHAEHLLEQIELRRATLIEYADKLRRGEVRMVPADLLRLHKWGEQLNEELRLANPHAPIDPQPVIAPRTPEHAAAVIAALRDGGELAALGIRTDDDEPELPQ